MLTKEEALRTLMDLDGYETIEECISYAAYDSTVSVICINCEETLVYPNHPQPTLHRDACPTCQTDNLYSLISLLLEAA